MVLRGRHIRWQDHSGCDLDANPPKTRRIPRRLSVFSPDVVSPPPATSSSVHLTKRHSGLAAAGRAHGPSQAVRSRLSLLSSKMGTPNRREPLAARRKAPLPREELPEEKGR